jgi:hypothetical protein
MRLSTTAGTTPYTALTHGCAQRQLGRDRNKLNLKEKKVPKFRVVVETEGAERQRQVFTPSKKEAIRLVEELLKVSRPGSVGTVYEEQWVVIKRATTQEGRPTDLPLVALA